MPVVRVLVDAAILYSATLLSALLCFVNANNGQYVLLDMVNSQPTCLYLGYWSVGLTPSPQITPIISIAFYMVLIRIGMRRRKARLDSSALSGTTPVQSQGTSYGMKPLQVHISRFSRNDVAPLGNQEAESGSQPSMQKGRSDSISEEV